MKKIFLNYLMRRMATKQAGGSHFARGLTVKRLGPIASLLVMALLVVFAVVGIVGFALLSAVFAVYAVGRSLLGSARIAPAKPEPTITVIDANGKTVAEVPRSA